MNYSNYQPGNSVTIEDGKLIHNIIEVRPMEIVYKNGYLFTAAHEDVKPIPLTAEILKELGADTYGNNYCGIQLIALHYTQHSYRIKTNDDDIEIHYLHELQNYFMFRHNIDLQLSHVYKITR